MSIFIPNSILVTGGMGFIGSNFIRYLLTINPRVRIINLDLCTYAASEDNLRNLPDPDRHILIKGNINNSALVSTILEEYKVDSIVNFAAESHVDKSISNPEDFISTNIVGTFTLLESARKIWLENNRSNEDNCRFYHISTDEIYGSCSSSSEPSFLENSPYKPSSPYSASKAASNHLVNSYYTTYKLPTIISNCTNNYGPYQHLEKFVPKIINCCLNEEVIPIYGDGSNIRDWLYVQDHCEAIAAILARGDIGDEYNIGANNEISNIDIANRICVLMDQYVPRSCSHKQLIRFINDRPGHDWRYSLNCSKIIQTIGWMPRTSIEDGLRKTIEFYLSNQAPKLPRQCGNITDVAMS